MSQPIDYVQNEWKRTSPFANMIYSINIHKPALMHISNEIKVFNPALIDAY